MRLHPYRVEPSKLALLSNFNFIKNLNGLVIIVRKHIKVTIDEHLVGTLCNDFGFYKIKSPSDYTTDNRDCFSNVDNSFGSKFS